MHVVSSQPLREELEEAVDDDRLSALGGIRVYEADDSCRSDRAGHRATVLTPEEGKR
jgi:hypothetical protein